MRLTAVRDIPGEFAGASLKLVAPRAGLKGLPGHPRRIRRGLIEAYASSPCWQPSSHNIPGEFAGASLKLRPAVSDGVDAPLPTAKVDRCFNFLD